jgi:predicted AlkP superfamily pyrophosphatase or phosphodiesterase
MFSNESDGDLVTQVASGGTHGYINTDPKMQAIFIAWGAGIPKGVRLNSISNLDVAPTIAVLLGLEMKQAKGHAIPEIATQGTGR